MAQCTALWIVTPIKQAVDDKVARDLLAKSLKLQLKVNGLISDVAFICSITDGILIGEGETLDENHTLEDLRS